MIAFEILGTPAPQGSKRHVGRGIMVESSKAVKPWRIAVAWAAREAMAGQPPLDGPLVLTLEFRLAPPSSASRKKLALGPCRKPDLDKLLRSTLDGLCEGGLMVDDARVVEIRASKSYAAVTGATVKVEP
jgi:crossover junction endodeoxyribonuclease RusA